jgi:hypothetical protein
VNELFTYRCPQCKGVAIATIRLSDPPMKCPLCRWSMVYLYATPVSAEEWQARNLNPPVFRSAHEIAQVRPEDREKRCGRLGCVQYRKASELLNGRFCSEACGAKDSLETEAYWQRIETLRKKYPYIEYPRRQEVTQ